MLRIFKDAVYIRDYGKETQDDNKFESLAVNSDYVVSILPCDENFDRADKEVANRKDTTKTTLNPLMLSGTAQSTTWPDTKS
jgi:hypothetical protein